MLDIQLIREQQELVNEGLRKKQVFDVDLTKIIDIDVEHRKILVEVETLRAEMNFLSNEIARAKSQRDDDAAAKLLQEAETKKDALRDLEPREAALNKELRELLRSLPNIPLPDVPEGKDEKDNRVLREMGEKPQFSFPPRDYLSLAERLELLDMDRAAKVSGSRFGYLMREAAVLEFGLARFALDLLTDQKRLEKIATGNTLNVSPVPFIPVIPPVLVRPENMEAMGYTERGKDEIYYLEKDELYLVGTSEQAIGPMHKDEIFEESDLPKRYVGFSTCFRREAGSYGKDTRGILRVHQFDKLEMFSFSRPDTSGEEHKFLLALEESLMQALELPYRVMNICTGDLGDPAAAKYDLEAWLPGQNNGKGEYRETHSTSNTTDFQARRLGIRVRRHAAGDKRQADFVHMLNGTAFAIGRMLIAIFENYQQQDGSIRMPDALVPYCGFDVIKR